MAVWLRQSTAVCAAVGPFVSDNNPRTAVIGIGNQGSHTVVSGDHRLKKAGANWVSTGSFFANEDGGGWFYEIALTANDVDTLGQLCWTTYACAAVTVLPVWHTFEVINAKTYDAYFGTESIRADVVMWDHVSATNVLISANVGQWKGAVPASLGSASTIPADVLYWNHGSVAGIVTAGAPSINLVTWAGAAVSAMPGAPGAIAGSVDVSSWGGKAVAAITTAGAIPVDVMYFNHTNSAGNAGILQVNVVQWLSAALAAGNAGIPVVDVLTWQHTTAASIVTAGTIPADIMYYAHSASAAVAAPLQVDVSKWDHVSAASVTVSANVGSFTAGVQLPAVTSVVNIGSGAMTATSFADAAIRQATLATTLLVSANVGSIGSGVMVSANVGQWRGTVPSLLSGTLVQSHVGSMSAGTVNYAAVGFDAYKKITLWLTGSAGVGSSKTQVSAVSISPNSTDFYKGSVILMTSGTCQGVMRRITGQAGSVVSFAAMPFEVSAGDEFGFLMTSWMEAPGGAAADVNVLTWLGATPNTLNAGNVRADVMMIDHISAANVLVSANVGQWKGAVPASLGSASTIPADVLYWNHGSVAGIVTAGAPNINVVTWAGSPVSAMPGAGGVAGSVDVSSWGGTAVAAIVSGGWPRVEIASYAAGEAPLQPTVAGRTLDVSTGGEVGIDWANVGTPGATVNLAATTLGLLGASAIGASSFAASAIDANALAASAVDEILDDTLEGTMTVRQALRIILSAVAGKLSGAATTNVLIRDIGDTKNRINATVDAAGDRTAITLDGT